MRWSILSLVAFLTCFSFQQTQAQEYVSLYSGAVFLNEYDGEGPIFVGPPDANGTFKDGFVLSGAIGQRVGNGYRVELEFAYRGNDGNDWSVFGTSPLTGTISSFATMLNATRDLDCLSFSYFTPYVGGGFGLVFINGDLNTPATTVNVEGTELGYQGIAGVRTELFNNLNLLTEYRLFGTTDAHISTGNGLISEDITYVTQNIFIGLQYNY